MTVDGHSRVTLMKGVDGLAEGHFHMASSQKQNFERREKRERTMENAFKTDRKLTLVPVRRLPLGALPRSPAAIAARLSTAVLPR